MSLEDLSPAELQQLRLGKLLLESNPEIAMDAKKLARRADPRLRLPEVDLEEKLEAERKARAELEDRIERQRIEDRVTERERAAKKLIEDSGYTPEEIEKIVKDEELHGEAGIKTALKLAQLQREAAAPGAIEVGGGANHPGPRDMRGDPDWRKLSAGGMRRKASELGHQMIDEFWRKQRGARGNGG